MLTTGKFAGGAKARYDMMSKRPEERPPIKNSAALARTMRQDDITAAPCRHYGPKQICGKNCESTSEQTPTSHLPEVGFCCLVLTSTLILPSPHWCGPDSARQTMGDG
jgi:hypothetical protein